MMTADMRAGLRRAWLLLFAWFWLIGLALTLTASYSPPVQEVGKGTLAYPMVEPRKGESCVVCGKAIGVTDRVYEVEGQRVPVHVGACDNAFRRSPGYFLARLKPRGAFLGAEPNLGPNISWGWFAFGIYVLLGLLFGALCSYRAVDHALKPLPWFLAGFFLNILGFLALMTRSAGTSNVPGSPPGLVKVPTTYSPRSCPRCGAMNHPSATSCAECGKEIEPLVTSEVSRVGLRGSRM
jgi:hypothetical protein